MAPTKMFLFFCFVSLVPLIPVEARAVVLVGAQTRGAVSHIRPVALVEALGALQDFSVAVENKAVIFGVQPKRISRNRE
jgi:hypothetical protein